MTAIGSEHPSRLYGSAVELYDQTWKPDDVVKVK
jgi:hypothetical protein